jgi:hypothetical protein
MSTKKNDTSNFVNETTFVHALKEIIESARTRAYAAVNFAQVEANWLIGRQIGEQEQHGSARAEYGKQIIALASRELTKEFGRGFSERSLRQFRQFYQIFPDAPIRRTALAESAGLPLSDVRLVEMQGKTNLANTVRQIPEAQFRFLTWSHIQRVLRVDNAETRIWYNEEDNA